MRAAEIQRLLPAVFQRAVVPGQPLEALLQVMEAMHAPVIEELERLDATFDPRRTRDEFVPVLARWLDLDRLFRGEADQAVGTGRVRAGSPGGPGAPAEDARAAAPLPIALPRLRRLTSAAAELSQWRGTCRGLALFLELATGSPDFVLRENVRADGRPAPFHLWVQAPGRVRGDQTLIDQIIRSEKPAYVTHELTFGGGPMSRESPADSGGARHG